MAKSIAAQVGVGVRVRIKGQPVGVWCQGVKLQGDRGVILRPDEDVDLGYYVVKLDIPALVDGASSAEWQAVDTEPQTHHEITELVWLEDNLEVITS